MSKNSGAKNQHTCMYMYLHYSAVVDVSLGEDLGSVEVLKPFRETGQFSKFGEEGTCIHTFMYVCTCYPHDHLHVSPSEFLTLC